MPARIKPTLRDSAIRLCLSLKEAGGRAYLVGGSVRDLLLGHPPKDYDFEVYGIAPERLQTLLAGLGRCDLVGRSFGVFKLWIDGEEIDVALPRTERKEGHGHTGFAVRSDHRLDPETASSRRDFTINAMMFDPISEELLDFHGGREDLEARLLRHVSATFAEDPLRVLRGMQFAARFGMRLDPATADLCRSLLTEAETISKERIWIEWEKWSRSKTPSLGLRVIEECGWLSLYPELAALKACPQDPKWHPEGDVWEHTCQVVDRAAEVSARHGWLPAAGSEGERRRIMLFAALCHDLGKPVTTHRCEGGSIRSPDHSIEGIEPTRTFLKRIGAPASLKRFLPPLVREHIVHLHGGPSSRAVRRLAARLEPADIILWEALVEADASGRAPHPHSRPARAWLEKAEEMRHHESKPEAIVTGRMLIGLGIEPGPTMGGILNEAYEAQLDGLFSDENGGMAWCRDRLKR